jgi:hypothetical protein
MSGSKSVQILKIQKKTTISKHNSIKLLHFICILNFTTITAVKHCVQVINYYKYKDNCNLTCIVNVQRLVYKFIS